MHQDFARLDANDAGARAVEGRGLDLGVLRALGARHEQEEHAARVGLGELHGVELRAGLRPLVDRGEVAQHGVLEAGHDHEGVFRITLHVEVRVAEGRVDQAIDHDVTVDRVGHDLLVLRGVGVEHVGQVRLALLADDLPRSLLAEVDRRLGRRRHAPRPGGHRRRRVGGRPARVRLGAAALEVNEPKDQRKEPEPTRARKPSHGVDHRTRT